MTLKEKLILIFIKKQFSFDFETKTVNIYKIYKGKMYIFAQEPIQYGDARNGQLNRLESSYILNDGLMVFGILLIIEIILTGLLFFGYLK